MSEPLFRLHETEDLVDPAFVVAFDGWVDAGAAATTAAGQLASHAAIVATFDADLLYDYRARRPTLEIVDGRTRSLEWPELVLRRTRVGSRDVLVLAGPEPDYRWHALSSGVVDLARQLGVTEWIGLGAIQAAVPHTRQVPVIGTESRPGLLRAGVVPGPEGVLRVPAAVVSVLDYAVSTAGMASLAYFAQVPHYVTGLYPAAALELLRVLGRHLGHEIPSGSLGDDARELRSRLDGAASSDETTRAYVERLEAMVDESRLPAGDELIADIERFLREQGSGGSGRP
jgi:hypothetical protein